MWQRLLNSILVQVLHYTNKIASNVGENEPLTNPNTTKLGLPNAHNKGLFPNSCIFRFSGKSSRAFLWRLCILTKYHWFGDSPCSRAALELCRKVEHILLLSALFCSLAHLASDSQSRSSIWQIWLETFQDGNLWWWKGILRRRNVRNTNPKLVISGINPIPKTIVGRPRTGVQDYWPLNSADGIIFCLWWPC